MKSPLTTLCYLEQDGNYLMMHRVKKEHDVNEGKWIGVGGHFEPGESPEECLLREVKEETGLTLTSWKFRGIVTFTSDDNPTEYMCLYTADGFEGTLTEDCREGILRWVPKEEVLNLRLWEGGIVPPHLHRTCRLERAPRGVLYRRSHFVLLRLDQRPLHRLQSGFEGCG